MKCLAILILGLLLVPPSAGQNYTSADMIYIARYSYATGVIDGMYQVHKLHFEEGLVPESFINTVIQKCRAGVLAYANNIEKEFGNDPWLVQHILNKTTESGLIEPGML
ncbi:MAG: hypothetical protein A4E45_00063 [Methanosaeta sp. PtaB.Bin039]|nr:MAG: hypothetical protein A4E45_00063 [Methanosaeta sp. PtaB.Bin039]